MLTPDQWRRIERLFESVENAPPEDQERLVYESGEDDSIRWQVLQMLAAAAGDRGLLDVNLRARPASVYSPGDLLLGGRFRIEALIAEGGMGEVYRAVDTELNTEVALKTIHRVLAHDSFAVERFKQEVQLARSVNHPNVCRIFDLEKQPGKNGRDQFFLTMELLSGENLRQFLDREKKVPPGRAFEIIEPVLQALMASHDRGVLHRDLKPSNIHLAQSNKPGGATRVVVTDFGLATSAFSSKSGLATSAGTPAYMAPEQFDQQDITPATDVYAAGVLLYELLAGRLPFTGKTPEEVGEQKRLNQAIPIRQLAPDIPKRWEIAIHRALQAAPEKRFESAATFLSAIRPRRNMLIRWGAIAAAVLVIAAGLAAYWHSTRTSNGSLASRKLTTDSGFSMEPSISADGAFVVYTSDRAANGVRALWRVSTSGDPEPQQLTFGEVDDHEPHLARDGRHVVYRSERNGGGLYLLDLSTPNGEPKRLVDGGTRPRFSPDGNWILYMAMPATATQLPQVYAVRAQGGSPIHISAGFSDAHNPIWSEDGKFILFCGTKTPGIPSEEHDWWIIPFITGGVARKTGVLPGLTSFAQRNMGNRLNEDLWEWRGGYVYFSSPIADSSSIWRLKFSPESPAVDPGSPPERLTYGTGLDTQPAIGGGRIVFASSISNIDVWTLPLNPNTGEPHGPPQRVTDTTDYEVSPTADPEGRKLVFTKAIGGRRELRFLEWGKDHDSVAWSNLNEVTDHPLFSHDGKQVAYRVYDKPKLPIDVKDLSGKVRRACEDCGAPTDWSPDGRYLLYEPGSTIAFVSRLNVATGKWEEWLQHPRFSLRGGRYSPDGKWIAFQAETSRNARRIFIAPDRKQSSEKDWIPIGWSDSEMSDLNQDPPVDLLPSWSPDGKLLYFLSGRDGFRCIWAQRLDPATKRPAGLPFHVQHFHRSRRSLLRIVTARSPQIGFRVYRDRAFFSMDEVTGNVWIADLPRQ